MHRLYTYLCAIHALPSSVKTVNKTETLKRFSEGENTIEECEILYVFNNDVQILYRMESETFNRMTFVMSVGSVMMWYMMADTPFHRRKSSFIIVAKKISG